MSLTRGPRGLAVLIGVFAAGLAVFGWRYLPYLGDGREFIGTDYCYFLPHLLAGNYWFEQNGPFAIPWATPAFCGGIPFYPNPQSLYYSPTQWLSFVIGPLSAVRISILLYAGAGAAGMALLVRRTYGGSWAAAMVGGVVFLFNGFYSHRMLIGHFAFAPFMLTPLAASVLAEPGRGRQWIVNGLIAGLIFAAMFQAGMVVLFGPALLAIAWIGVLLELRRGNGGQEFLKGLVLALLSAALLSAAKLVSGAAFVSNFPRDFYPTPGIPSLVLLIETALKMLFGYADAGIAHAFVKARVVMGEHEWEYGLGPAVPCVLAVAGLLRWQNRQNAKAGSSLRYRRAALWIIFLVPLALNFYTPAWNGFIHALPIIAQSQTLSRWFAFYIPTLTLATSLAFDAIPWDRLAKRGTAIGCAVVVLVTVGFHLDEDRDTPSNPHIPQAIYKPGRIKQAWANFETTGEVPPIEHVSQLVHDGQADLIEGDSQLGEGVSAHYCYEPLFGYSLQKFPMGTLHAGATLEIDRGWLNLKDPACFVYPEANHCKPGDEMPAARLPDARALVTYHPTAWEQLISQSLANFVNLLALFAVPAGILILRRRASEG